MTAPDSAIVVGAGITGCTIARVLAHAGTKVEVLDCRDQIGGLCADHTDPHGNMVQDYGPHFFHTNDLGVVDFLNQFCGAWSLYHHRVKARAAGQLYQFPVNDDTCCALGTPNVSNEVDPTGLDAQTYLDQKIGPLLTAYFFSGYSQKQWGVPLREIPAWVVARVNPRRDRNPDYFLDTFQGVPKAGFSIMLLEMLNHDNISLDLGCKPIHVRSFDRTDRPLVYTGSLDHFFDYSTQCRIGTLLYRHTEFRFVNIPGANPLPATCINECDLDTPHTRLTDNHQMYHRPAGSFEPDSRTFTLERSVCTAPGNPSDEGTVACYPIPWDEGAKERHAAYLRLAQELPYLYVAGRLADYKYYNMDQAVRRGLDVASLILRGERQC
jgi:UDP-galactopyranose mutase